MTGADDERRLEGNPGGADRGDRCRSHQTVAGVSGWVALVSRLHLEGRKVVRLRC